MDPNLRTAPYVTDFVCDGTNPAKVESRPFRFAHILLAAGNITLQAGTEGESLGPLRRGMCFDLGQIEKNAQVSITSDVAETVRIIFSRHKAIFNDINSFSIPMAPNILALMNYNGVGVPLETNNGTDLLTEINADNNQGAVAAGTPVGGLSINFKNKATLVFDVGTVHNADKGDFLDVSGYVSASQTNQLVIPVYDFFTGNPVPLGPLGFPRIIAAGTYYCDVVGLNTIQLQAQPVVGNQVGILVTYNTSTWRK